MVSYYLWYAYDLSLKLSNKKKTTRKQGGEVDIYILQIGLSFSLYE